VTATGSPKGDPAEQPGRAAEARSTHGFGWRRTPRDGSEDAVRARLEGGRRVVAAHGLAVSHARGPAGPLPGALPIPGGVEPAERPPCSGADGPLTTCQETCQERDPDLDDHRGHGRGRTTSQHRPFQACATTRLPPRATAGSPDGGASSSARLDRKGRPRGTDPLPRHRGPLRPLLLAAYFAKVVNAADPGNEVMQEIAAAIRDGAMAFLRREYRAIAIFVVGLSIVIFACCRRCARGARSA
jgi:hypothetical protein